MSGKARAAAGDEHDDDDSPASEEEEAKLELRCALNASDWESWRVLLLPSVVRACRACLGGWRAPTTHAVQSVSLTHTKHTGASATARPRAACASGA